MPSYVIKKNVRIVKVRFNFLILSLNASQETFDGTKLQCELLWRLAFVFKNEKRKLAAVEKEGPLDSTVKHT